MILNDNENKKRDYFIIGICIVLIIVLIIGGIVFVRSGSVTYKYSRATIEILEQYKDNKVDEEEVMNELNKIEEELEELQSDNDDMKLSSLKLDISNINTDFLISNINLIKIDEYIFNLKTQY